jgi:hypothetical protein
VNEWWVKHKKWVALGVNTELFKQEERMKGKEERALSYMLFIYIRKDGNREKKNQEEWVVRRWWGPGGGSRKWNNWISVTREWEWMTKEKWVIDAKEGVEHRMAGITVADKIQRLHKERRKMEAGESRCWDVPWSQII